MSEGGKCPGSNASALSDGEKGYLAVFPFKSLHLVHEKPTINRVLGGQMQFLSDDDFE